MELETTFYIMGIIFMAIMFILMIAAVIAIFAIKRKIDRIHHNIEEKIHTFMNIAHVGSELIDKARNTFRRQA